jgi:hypothetical protein
MKKKKKGTKLTELKIKIKRGYSMTVYISKVKAYFPCKPVFKDEFFLIFISPFLPLMIITGCRRCRLHKDKIESWCILASPQEAFSMSCSSSH